MTRKLRINTVKMPKAGPREVELAAIYMTKLFSEHEDFDEYDIFDLIEQCTGKDIQEDQRTEIIWAAAEAVSEERMASDNEDEGELYNNQEQDEKIMNCDLDEEYEKMS